MHADQIEIEVKFHLPNRSALRDRLIAQGAAPGLGPVDAAVRALEGHTSYVTAVAVSADGRFVYGNRLFFDLGKSGRTINISGEAPLNVLFGDAANVTLRVDDVERPISASERRGKTARLTIRP